MMRRRTWRWHARIALIAGLGVGWVAPAAHAAPYEPNDSFLQASGPMVGGQDYVAAKETENDVDWFYFNTAGQRQVDISLTALSSGCSYVELHDAEGNFLTDEYFATGLTRHILWTAPSSLQYALRARGSAGCQYRLRIDPADAITTTSPGIVVAIDGSDESDDVQSILVDGTLAGTVQGTTGESFTLGQLAPTSRIIFEAKNATGGWSWDVTITNQTDRLRTTLFTEDQDGYDARVGIVRRVVLTPSGNALESCGEALAPVTCIPADKDGDGFASDRDCNDADKAIKPGAPEVLDNAIDENCDGVAATRPRYGATVSLKRRGKRYRGRVTSGGDCTAGRKVVLRRKGDRTRYATAVTRSTGKFVLKPPARVRGRVYAVVAAKKTALSKCRSSRSSRIRG